MSEEIVYDLGYLLEEIQEEVSEENQIENDEELFGNRNWTNDYTDDMINQVPLTLFRRSSSIDELRLFEPTLSEYD